MTAASLIELSAVEASSAMQSGSLTAEAYALALCDQCERCKGLNAFITLHKDQVLADARAADQLRASGAKLRPLHGIPIPVKDSINTENLRTTAGTPALRDFHPAHDAPIVQRLREAGAIVLGKTNLHELSLGWTGNNLAFGAVRNPYDPARIAGGSSSGTAAAVAARMAPLGLSEDTEGSIRVPAALCGIAGFRPTTGRYPSEGTAPTTDLFDQVGPHARTIADLALFDSVVTGDHRVLLPAIPRGIKLGVLRDYWFTDLDPEVERVTESALQRLQDAGIELVETEMAELPDLIQRTTVPIQNHDIFTTLPKYLADYQAGVTFDELVAQASPDVRAFFAFSGHGGSGFVDEVAYGAARHIYLPRLRHLFRDYFASTGAAAIVFPTTTIPAPFIGQEEAVTIGNKIVPFATAIARNIGPGSTAGVPGLVLPAGLTQSGLPAALEFDGPPNSDRELLALGLTLENILWRLPPPGL